MVDQAKGMLAEREQITPAAAFAELRGQSRPTRRRLRDVARDITEGRL